MSQSGHNAFVVHTTIVPMETGSFPPCTDAVHLNTVATAIPDKCLYICFKCSPSISMRSFNNYKVDENIAGFRHPVFLCLCWSVGVCDNNYEWQSYSSLSPLCIFVSFFFICLINNFSGFIAGTCTQSECGYTSE